MAKQIVWTLQAHNDRKSILNYWRIHNQSSTYSKKLNELFKKAVQLLSEHPHVGRRTDIENVRVKIVRDYLIFYEEKENVIAIISIWDSRRNPEEMPYKTE